VAALAVALAVPAQVDRVRRDLELRHAAR